MTNNKQQTAVEWYSKEIGKLTSDLITGKITGKQFVMLEIQLLEKAKAIHKEEIIEAYDEGVIDECIYATFSARDFDKTGEQYYNENYGGGEQ